MARRRRGPGSARLRVGEGSRASAAGTGRALCPKGLYCWRGLSTEYVVEMETWGWNLEFPEGC